MIFRYAAVPLIDVSGGPNNVILAFDFMRIQFADLCWAPATTRALEAAFPEISEENDDEEIEGQINSKISSGAAPVAKKAKLDMR